MPDVMNEQVARPHHYMNADGTCHAGDLFEAGTPSVEMYDAETVARMIAEAKSEALREAASGMDVAVSWADVYVCMPRCHKMGCYCNGTGDGATELVVTAVANCFRDALVRRSLAIEESDDD